MKEKIMTGVFPCTICDTEFDGSGAITPYVVPLFNYTDNEKVGGWNSRIDQCSPCRETLGKPVKVLQRPYELDFAVFSKSDKPVVLKGSYPRD